MLECVANVSEGQDPQILQALQDAAGPQVLDLHIDPDHHRSVFTLTGELAVRRLTSAAVNLIDIATHVGAHPRLGAVDVVPFVPLLGSTMNDAVAARNNFATWAADELHVPCFFYGPIHESGSVSAQRSLPYVRKNAWTSLVPDIGPRRPHPTAGAICVGARQLLVAYNIFLPTNNMDLARRIVKSIRGPGIRTLAFLVDGKAQISMNLVDLDLVGIADAYDRVAIYTPIERAELVGLIPRSALDSCPEDRWLQLDIGVNKTIEGRLDKL